MAKIVTYESDKRRKDFLKRYASDFAAAAEHLFGLTLSPSKRKFFNALCGSGDSMAVDNQLGSIADATAIQSAILCLLLRPDAVVNVVVRRGEGVTEGELNKMLSLQIKRVTKNEPWLIEYLRHIGESIVAIGGKRSISGQLAVIFYDGNSIDKLAGFGDALWILPRADTVEDRAVSIMGVARVVAFYNDIKRMCHVAVGRDNKPVERLNLAFERSSSF